MRWTIHLQNSRSATNDSKPHTGAARNNHQSGESILPNLSVNTVRADEAAYRSEPDRLSPKTDRLRPDV